VSAYISSVSNTGLMEIRFNSSMFTKFNFSLMNETTNDIYVKPADNRHEWDGYNNSQVNLTWSLVYYEVGVMRIQLNFKHPLQISPLTVQDRIVWHIKKNDTMFYHSIPLNKDLHADYWTLEAPLKRQQGVPGLLLQKADMGTQIFIGFFGSAAVASLLVAGPFFGFIWYLRSLQMIVHLPMMQTVMPSNAISFTKSLMPAGTYDLFDATWFDETLLQLQFDDNY